MYLLLGVVFVWIVFLSIFLWRIYARQRIYLSGKGVIHIDEVLNTIIRDQDDLNQTLTHQKDQLLGLDKDLKGTFSRLGLHKFDSLDNDRGNYSFALALLDEHDSGLVISVFHTNDRVHLYPKKVIKGTADVALSPEEEKALKDAKK
ncbi:MAG: hypothetical protein UZ21_OP11001000836 [Microgenomates bacterium OLB22]|nr:MAG: hypothetical protein UZ21_OP11001000836 [Microgenomates bacterium OLB22]